MPGAKPGIAPELHMPQPAYRRALVKVSGEALLGGAGKSIDQGILEGIASDPVSYTHLTLPTNREV